jgi:enamine deaminase RidA (YjgF/YER057c/UK114 family)
MSIERMHISTGTPWEKKVGYSRAVRVGEMVFVSGTVVADEGGAIVAPGNAGEQARHILRKIEKALREAGATMGDVVRTRMYVTDMAHMDAVGAAHGEVFGEIRPASTMVAVAGLVPGALVEIEVEAVVGSRLRRG